MNFVQAWNEVFEYHTEFTPNSVKLFDFYQSLNLFILISGDPVLGRNLIGF